MNEMKIGDFIKDARIRNGYKTKKELSEVTGVSPATLTRIENNSQIPTPDTLLKISKQFERCYIWGINESGKLLRGSERRT